VRHQITHYYNTGFVGRSGGTGMSMGHKLLYLGNTVPISTVLQLCAGMLVPVFQSGE
jgi:hypothetical protein